MLKKGFFVLIIIIIVFGVIYLVLYNKETENSVTTEKYTIKIFLNNKLIHILTLTELHKLRNYSFVDSTGHLQEGPLLFDVIKYVVGNETFKYVIIIGSRKNMTLKLMYDIVSNRKNLIIFDYTNRNTVKLCGKENILPRENWVKDIIKLKIYR